MVGSTTGMFLQRVIDITDKVTFDRKNVLAVKVYPVDMPGTIRPKGGKSFGANGEFQNGGNGERPHNGREPRENNGGGLIGRLRHIEN